MPTPIKPATQDTSEEDLNKINTVLRMQPWYQQWFSQRGLNPNKVKLSKGQQQELQNLAARNGYEIGDRMKFDEAGNVNQKGGFAGMPTWAKIAISAAPVAASMAIPGVREATVGQLGSIFGGGGGVGAAGTGSGATAAGNFASQMAANPMIPKAASPSLFSRIAGFAKSPADLISAGGRMLAQAGQASAANRGTELDARMAHDQLSLQAEREKRDAETDAFRKSLYGQIAAGYAPLTRPEGIPSRAPAGGYITPEARESGRMMTDTAMNRMRTQDYPSITPFSDLPVKPGLFERIAGYAGPAMSLFDPRLYEKKEVPNGKV